MKLLLLGATGRTGKLVLKLALQQGYEVHCLVRDSTKLSKHELLTIFEGNAQDYNILSLASEGCDCIISALNISRTSDFPWSPLRTPESFLSDVMKNIVSLKEENLKRVIVCSAWGVSETKKDLPFWFRWFIDHSNIGAAYSDHERQEAILKNSTTNWTIVRPSGLTNSKKAQKVKESFNNDPKPSLLINRLSVAKYMIDAIEKKSLFQKTVVISKA